METYRFCRYRKDSVIIGSVDDICGAFFTQVPEENIFLDYPTKEKRSRIQYNKLIKLLKEDDLLYVSSFTALGDGYKEVEEQWRFLTKTKNVDVVLLDMSQIDTRKGKSAYGPIIADTVLAMLEYVADEENSLRKMRQKEGIALAKERGIIFGRQEKATPEFQKAYLILEECYKNDKKLLIAGNGGSAADAEHMARELMKRFRIYRPIQDSLAKELIKIDAEREKI